MLKPTIRWRGLGLVELLVGLAVALLVLSGAVTMAGVHLGEHHRLLLELQVQQELRATVELMLRDLKRAGSGDRTQSSVWADAASTEALRPAAELRVDDDGQRLSYSFVRADVGSSLGDVAGGSGGTGGSAGGTGANGSGGAGGTGGAAGVGGVGGTSGAREIGGFRWSEGRLDQLIAGRYQPLTDPSLLRITRFQASLTPTDWQLPDFCSVSGMCSSEHAVPAAAADPRTGSTRPDACIPRLRRHGLWLRIEAAAAHDARVQHGITLFTHLRNDQWLGACP